MRSRPSTRALRPLACAAALIVAVAGCDRVDHPADRQPAVVPAHTHAAQHGGIAVQIGEEEYHVEFTHGETPDTLDAYFMDGEMEDYVRLAVASFGAVAHVDGHDFPLEFRAVANPATGETVGDSALFEARADWLTAMPALKISVPSLTIKGHVHTDLSATLPGGKTLPSPRAPGATVRCPSAVSDSPPPRSPAFSSHAPTIAKLDGEDVYVVGFDQLSAFDYTIVDAGTGATPAQIAEAMKRDPVPDWIRFYQDKRIVLTGYLMPLQVENGRSKKFVMMKDVTTCCYGAVPNMNDYVVVAMKGDGIAVVQDVPVALIGVLHIEQKYENGYITALYQLAGEKFLGQKK